MAKLEITYPYISFYTINVEVPDDEADALMDGSHDDKVDFIYKQAKERDEDELTNRKLIDEALDWEYARILRRPQM
jgi:hypothetical protein